MSYTPEKPWTADGSCLFEGSDCIGVFDTDNATGEIYAARAALAASAPEMAAEIVRLRAALDQAKSSFFDMVADGSHKGQFAVEYDEADWVYYTIQTTEHSMAPFCRALDIKARSDETLEAAIFREIDEPAS